jgi:hypothetical protein
MLLCYKVDFIADAFFPDNPNSPVFHWILEATAMPQLAGLAAFLTCRNYMKK